MVDQNFAILGNEVMNTGFYGSMELLGLFLFAAFFYFLWKSHAPLETGLVFGLGITYTLWLMGNDLMGTVFWAGVALLGIYLALAIFAYTRRTS